MTEDLAILSDNLAVNIAASETVISSVAMLQGNMPWGNDMWGSETIWGAAYTNHYQIGARFVDDEDFALNIVRS
jgi:hypothetical protein